jgi:hypothetical protein
MKINGTLCFPVKKYPAYCILKHLYFSVFKKFPAI